MKIVFVGLASTFTPGMNYQDNALCVETCKAGHQVTYISNPEKFVNGKIVPTGYEDTVLEDGLHLYRLPYRKLGPALLTKKIRACKGVYKILEQAQPDVIFCHNTQYWSVLDVVRYKKKHPEVKLYADVHAAAYNSGTNGLSLHVLHRGLYRYLTKKLLPYLEKYFYVGASERDFAEENYGVPREMLEYYPLGGYLLSDTEYAEKRNKRREELCLTEGGLLFVHSGKLDALKRTKDLLQAFADVPELKAKLAIIGSIPDDMKPVLEPLIAADKRVQFLGWKNAAELQEYLCASDLYCQPGSVSATMQNAVCCNCPVMAYPHKPYTADLDFGNILWVETQEDMANAFRQIKDGQVDLQVLRSGSQKCARDVLDYRKLAARLFQ